MLTPYPKKYTDADIARLYDEYREQDKDLKTFCAERGLPYTTIFRRFDRLEARLAKGLPPITISPSYSRGSTDVAESEVASTVQQEIAAESKTTTEHYIILGKKIWEAFSIPGYVPVIVKDKNGVNVLPIEDLFNEKYAVKHGEYEIFPCTVCKHCGSIETVKTGHVQGKQRYKCKECGKLFYDKNKPSLSVQVLTAYSKQIGWVTPRRIIRHPFKGKILRIFSTKGIIDIAGDHSIFLFGRRDAVNAKELKVGDVLHLAWWKHKHLPRLVNCEDPSLTMDGDLVWAYGLFLAEGSCYYVKSKRSYIISLGMINKDVVNKFADIIKKNFGLNPHFHTYRKSSHNEMLIVTFHSKNLYQKFRQMFYTKNNEKKIPKEIINASNDVLLKFIEGYVAGDGCYYENGKGKFWKIFDKSPNVITALAFLEKKLGVEISCGLAKGHFTLRTVNNRIRDVNRAKIRKIIELPYEGYVYDIETPNHVFYGGIGYPVKLHNSAWASKKGYDLSKIKEMPIHEFVLDSLTKADEYDKLAKEYEETVEALDFYRSRTHPIIRLEQGIQMLKEFLEMALLMDALGIDIIDSDVGQYYANLIQDYLLGRTKSFKA